MNETRTAMMPSQWDSADDAFTMGVLLAFRQFALLNDKVRRELKSGCTASTGLLPPLESALKSCHALELPFVWNNLDKPGLSMFTQGATGIQPLADVMHADWIAFARTGNPNVPALPDWPPYDLHSHPTMVFNMQSEIVNDPQSAERKLWEEVI